MTNEQREAIRQCELYVQAKATIQLVDEIDGKLAFKSCDTSAIDTVLSLIKEQEIYINKSNNVAEEMNRDIAKLIYELKKKDKQIDLMAEYVSKQDIEEDICMKNKTNPDLCNENYTNCKNCIKQYFADLVEKE